ncbi:protein kinase, putative [Leishmania donovani]|uniref:non-specific serine/threonine protein kinase n=2 Tax=Leishmania donovani TaxID=5661 RepID=A0A3S5H675_LEIDO|nr:protein kinase, putative [Leishmania donovani]
MNAVDELNLLLGIGPSRPQLPLTLRKSGYVPVRSLGKGSFGQALLVFHEPQQQYFVVKHLNLASMSSRQRHDAHNEINILQKLHHPNIVRYVEYYEEHPHLYIVMEYADGGDVYSLLSSAQTERRLGATGGYGGGSASSVRPPGPSPSSAATAGLLSEAQVVNLFVQITMAVKYMHDRRLLHRDIKSSNIFLTKNHVVKLGDFGISTVLQSTVAMASTMCGTPCYFSPELCQGRPYNSKSDMWALGVLLYELCAGHVPFESTTMKALMRDIVHKQPPRIPAVYSQELWELIVQLLQKDARRRPDAGQVLMSPVLMKHVPDLINQLADDTTNDGNSAPRGASGACGGEAPRASAATPPPPPPRQAQQALPSPIKAGGGGVASCAPTAAAAAAAAAALPLSSSPASPSQARTAGKQVPSPPLQAQPKRHPSRGGGEAGAFSIEELVARFDAQKQQIAEAKRRKSGVQAEPHGTGGVPHASGADERPRLSPGAAAALRQQGLKGSNAGGGGREAPTRHSAGGASPGAAAAAPSRAAFMPPPLPAALRDAGAVDQRRPVELPTNPSPLSRQRDSAAAEQAPNSGNADAARQARGDHLSAPGVRGQPYQAPPQRRHIGGQIDENSAPPSSARGAAPALDELSAVLSELSSWRERSVLRQQRQGGHRAHRYDTSCKTGVVPKPQHVGAKADAHVPSPQPPTSPSAPATPRHQLSKYAEQAGAHRPGVAEGAPTHEPNGNAASQGKPLRDGGRGTKAGEARAAEVEVQRMRVAFASPAANRRGSDGDDTDGDESVTQSFVDALGTALDVDAVQAASAAAQQQQQQRLSPPPSPAEAGSASCLSGRVPFLQQSMKKTFHVTSEKIDALQPTLMAGTVFRHLPSTALLAGTMRGTDAAACVGEAEGVADVHFTTSCLCGRAATSRGCLSMIYGSFVCSCDACVRFTGSMHGVEWLHLPEVADGLPALLPSPTPSNAPGEWSTKERPSAGAGAAAAVALRAKAEEAPLHHNKGAEAKWKGSMNACCAPPPPAQSPGVWPPSPRAGSGAHAGDEATAALGEANVRAYRHCFQAEAPLQLEEAALRQPAPHTRGSTLTGGAAATRQSALHVLYTCLTCGSLIGMQHDGVEGLLLPKVTLDAQSLEILSWCAQTVDVEAAELIKVG